jgi:hypothetical protein
MIAYKVCLLRDGKFFSTTKQADFNNPYALEYKIGEKTVPIIGKLFVYDCAYNAIKDFGLIREDSIYRLFECEIEPSDFKTKSINLCGDFETLVRDFWNNPEIGEFAVSGRFLFANSVTLIREVTV